MARILVVGRPGLSTSIFSNELAKAGHELEIVFENRPAMSTMLAFRVRRLGPLTAVGQVLFLVYVRFAQRFHAERINQLLSEFALERSLPECTTVHKIDSVNSVEFQIIVKSIMPDVIFVSGARVIKEHTLRAVEVPIINCHFGITPRYRGVHGGYWAMVSDDADNFGSTIHLIDKGVDTGKIISQVRYRPAKQDNYFTYPCLQAAIAAPALLAAISEHISGTLQCKTAEGPSQQWYHPTIWGYFLRGWFRGVW